MRAVGLSNETPWGLLAFLSAASGVAGLPRVCSLQNAYSLTCRGFETSGLAEACHREGVSLLPYSPLAMGLLTGKYHAAQAQTQPGAATGTTAGRARGARDDDDGPAAEAGGGEGGGAGRDAGGRGAGEGVAVGGPPGARLNLYRDRYAEASSRYPVARPAVAAAVVAYGALARRFGLAPAALALRFAMSHPCVAAPLTGATDEAQLAQLLGAARDGPLPGELAAEVDALHAAHGDPTP